MNIWITNCIRTLFSSMLNNYIGKDMEYIIYDGFLLNKIFMAMHSQTYINAFPCNKVYINPLQWRHNERDRVSNHQPHHCLFNSLFRRRSKKTSKLRITGVCTGNSPVTGEFPARRTSDAKNVFIRWRHHDQGSYIHLVSLIPESSSSGRSYFYASSIIKML